jgi:hypothetical protein
MDKDRFMLLRTRDAPPRRELENAFNWLCETGADLDAVFEALATAKQKRIRAKVRAMQIDFRGDWEEQRTDALNGARRVLGFMRNLRLQSDDLREIENRFEFLKAIKFPIGSIRRERAGRQHQPWTSDARKELKELEVPRELSKELLLAVGLSQPRKKGG